MTLQISATLHHDHVVLEISDATGKAGASIGLSPMDALDLISKVARAVNELPSDRSAPLHQQQAFLRSKNPSFQVGLSNEGQNAILAIRPDPFPPIEFELDPETLTALINSLRKASIIPSQGGSSIN